MPVAHLLLGVLVMALWGFNFVVIKVGLDSFDPFLLAALRFLLSCLPWVLLFRRPKLPFRYVALYGAFFGIGQFGLLFAGIHAGFSAGLASVVMQLQLFWTIGFAALLLGERVTGRQLVGIGVAAAGMAMIGGISDGSVTLVGALLVVAASSSWAMANIVVKKAKPEDMLGFTIWASLIPPVPLFLLSVSVNGIDSVRRSFQDMTWVSVGSVLYLVYPTILFGFTAWGFLLQRHRTTLVAPLTLLVPIFGMASAVLVLDEPLGPLKATSIAVVILGLVINQFDLRPLRWLHARSARSRPARASVPAEPRA